MNRRSWLPALLLLLALPARAPAADDPRERAAQLCRQASELAEKQQYDEALKALAEAQQLAPEYSPTQSWLARVYELKGDKTQALVHLAALLALDPKSDFAREAARRLFYHPPFPRTLSPAALEISPVRFTVDRCLLGEDRVQGAPRQVGLCYTTSMKYPDDAPGGAPVLERALPVAGDKPQVERFNRAVYGYLETSDGDYRLRVIAYYPSALLLGAPDDLAPTAQVLVHLMLRFLCYSENLLGLPPQGDAEGINRLWLALGGPPGAQRSEADLFVYRVLADRRSPIEWVRQLAHESGHLLIPRIGGFAQPEKWGNGALGERLFIHLLTQEAARTSGSDWPSSAASARLDGLWGSGRLAVEDYLASSGRAPLAVWAPAGPASELIVGEDERAMQYYVGFNLYLLAAHGAPGLRDAIRACSGATTADFVYAYKQAANRWANAGPIELRPGGFDPSASRLTVAPPPAALAPETLILTAGDQVVYPVFLPTGRWELAVLVLPAEGSAPRLAVSFDGGAAVEAPVGPGTTAVPIGPLTESWHRVALRLPAGQPPLRVLRLVFLRAAA